MYLAGIILYNPEINFLKRNIETLLEQKFLVLLVDNGSENLKEIKKLENENVTILFNDRNRGIGKALNQICEFAVRKNIMWVLTLDQDSIVPHNILSEYLLRIDKPEVAVMCPSIMERNVNMEICRQDSQEEMFIEKCITSASFINILIWKTLGGFDEEMFIDYVDFDYCYKARKKGYRILRVPSVQLMHSLGESQMRRFLFWNVRVSNHEVKRKYYISRNTVIFMKRYKSLRVLVMETLRLFKLILYTVLYEKKKKEKMINIAKGIKDGLFWKA